MIEKKIAVFVLLAMILAGCSMPGGATPLEWLARVPFEAGREGQPDILPADLPDGFNAFEPEHGSAEMPGEGFTIYRSHVAFERPVGGQVNNEDSITVEFDSYDVPAGRTYHLDQITDQDYTWEFVELDGYRIARYHTASVDGRVWISGPYMIVIYSGLYPSGTAPWVDTFASLFLAMYPPN